MANEIKKYLDKAGLQVVWNKTKEIVGDVDNKAVANAANIEELAGKVATLEANGYDDSEVRGLIQANADAIDLVEADVESIKGDYLKAADKEEVLAAVNTEQERAEGVESGLDTRLVKVETFFETAEGETLDTALDTLVELQKYLDGEGEVADQMLLDIAANKKAIEDHVATDHDFAAADATLKSELEGQIALKADKTTVEAMDTAYKAADEALDARLDVLEAINHDAYITADTALKNELNGAIALKADQTALDTAVESLEGADEALDERIALLEGKFGETGSVATDIANAKQEAIDAAAADASNKDVVVLSEAQKYADEEDAKIEVRVDAVEALAAANKAAHEANAEAIKLLAAQADLDALELRVDAVEEWQANMVEVTEDEINGLFA